MYIPDAFREARPEVLHALIRRHALAALVFQTSAGLNADHIPMQLAHDGGGPCLRGHVARGNPMWRELSDNSAVLAIFRGAGHYISPSSYPGKQKTGRAVPTWNYAVAHVHGTIRFIHDRDWLRSFVESLTDEHERAQSEPWHVADAPAGYIDTLLRSIVGFEIRISRIEGKVKGSQNRDVDDRLGVAAALQAQGAAADDIAEIAPPP